MSWNRFPHYWPFAIGIHWSLEVPSQNGSNTVLWYCCCCCACACCWTNCSYVGDFGCHGAHATPLYCSVVLTTGCEGIINAALHQAASRVLSVDDRGHAADVGEVRRGYGGRGRLDLVITVVGIHDGCGFGRCMALHHCNGKKCQYSDAHGSWHFQPQSGYKCLGF